MVEFLQNLTQMEILLDSNLLGTILGFYFYLILIELVSFLNIYYVDKVEFMYSKQKYIEFKHRLFFIIQKSKEKRIVSIKTFILELIWYFITLLTIVLLVVSLFMNVTNSLIILGILFLIVIIFGWITAGYYGKAKKINIDKF